MPRGYAAPCSPSCGGLSPIDGSQVAIQEASTSSHSHRSGSADVQRRERSAAPTPESVGSPSSARRRASVSRVSKMPSESKSTKRRDRTKAAAEETAYFLDKFSNRLHPLYVGSAIAEESNSNSEWAEESTQGSVAFLPQDIVELVSVGAADESFVVADWYHDPRWAHPQSASDVDGRAVSPRHQTQDPRSAPDPPLDDHNASDDYRVLVLANQTQEWHEGGQGDAAVYPHADTGAKAAGYSQVSWSRI